MRTFRFVAYHLDLVPMDAIVLDKAGLDAVLDHVRGHGRVLVVPHQVVVVKFVCGKPTRISANYT